MKKNQLSIRLYGEPVGILEQTSTGKKIFKYESNAVVPISISMPLREQAYDDRQCEAFFGGLLPESELAKKLIGGKYGISANNTFALLRAIGYDCAGAISCHEMDEPVNPHRSVPLQGSKMTQDELYMHIRDIPKNPLFMDVEGLRLSLAGVQDKAAICLIDNEIALPENGCPTTHILKPASPHFEGLAENEYFVMKMAKAIGFPVPDVELRKIHDIHFLLIERYDRRIKNNFIERIHQEDFCQATSVRSIKKYQNDGGPGFKACFELLKNTAQPAVDRNLLASALVFNYLIGNMDAHAKNFSLLHHGASSIRLAPFYDLVCTRVYQRLTSKMAMKIGSKYDANDVLPRHWEQLCQEVGYGYPAMMDKIETLGKQIMLAALAEKEKLNESNIHDDIFDRMIKFISENIEKTLKKFSG
jgi:serine/threonine-protein kinase HipA